ncbi:taste receptor type 2 member 4-like [Engystomops pustulosus]|uniref:taste receptor type 2 member 4-like n=1 Tax=Engystomops pustulosus TaxID=76066 RepID=UPI003AFA4B7B
MKTVSNISVLVVQLLSLLITFPGYMFILVVNILGYRKNKRLDISDQLISGISLCNLAHRFLHVSLDFFEFSNGFLVSVNYKIYTNILYLSLIFCTLLFSTLLAVYYCLKIVNINHNVYIYIQRMFPKTFPWILLPSIFSSVLISIPAALRLTRKPFVNSTGATQKSENLLYFVPYNLFSSLCFLLFFSSALNIILSLRRHIKQMHNLCGYWIALFPMADLFTFLVFALSYYWCNNICAT